ncbi:hypothetical protein [Streptomyces rectiverticillatus]|uniref:hypothetical protein n=1 Tax=Streptomyces rectiverticillatus TaxID=173860 RepID=UPI0015C3739D|nr:hypothetical protein [Streptomyces rectiverticillatus]
MHVLLGTVALLGALATPASAADAAAVGSIVATAENAVSGLRSAVSNATANGDLYSRPGRTTAPPVPGRRRQQWR